MVKKLIGKKSQSKKKVKHLWEGVFNGQRTVYYLHRYAFTPEQARILFCREIAKRQGVPDWMVLQYFQPEKENYIIKMEVEFKEND
jgi:hypothetical protein